MVEDLTSQGFRLWVRNPHECARSSAGFNWLAVAEVPGSEQPSHLAIHPSVVRPRFFRGRCKGPARQWPVTFGPNRTIGTAGTPTIVLATATNLNIWATTGELQSAGGGPVYAYAWGTSYNAAVAAAAQGASPNGFTLKGSNSDGQHGNCAFFHAAFAESQTGSSGLFVRDRPPGCQVVRAGRQ